MVRQLAEYLHLHRAVRSSGAEVPQWFAGARVVFHTFRWDVKHLWDLEFFFAALLARGGAEVWMVLDDGVFRHFEHRQHRGESDIPQTMNPWHRPQRRMRMKALQALNRWAYGDLPIRFLYTRGIPLRSAPSLGAGADRSDAITGHALSSTKRFFQAGELDRGSALHQAYYRLSLENAAVSRQVGEYVAEDLRPDLVLTSHGIYSTWGPAYEAVREAECPVLVYGIHPYVPGAVQLSEEPLQLTGADRHLRSFLEGPYHPDRRRAAEEIFRAREAHKAHDTRVYYAGVSREAGLRDLPRPTFGVFPNVVWDGDIEQRNTLFQGMFDWLVSTVRFFVEREDLGLVLRFHPSESTLETGSPPLQGMLAQALPDLEDCPNIRIIPSHEPVDSYELIRNVLDAVVVYDGMLGLEAPIMGVPTILAARGRFSGVGVALEPRDTRSYFEMLAGPDALQAWNEERRREAALRVMSWFMEDAAYPVPTVNPDVVVSSQARGVTSLAGITPEDLSGGFDDSRPGRTLKRFAEELARSYPHV